MNHKTTGQRIAARRKLANLSQEQISEQLGVSRQAVSKWESDVGLPDVDNLIALSKIFGVSVGWLLGTEQDPNFDPSTGLSDAQLKMVQQIVSQGNPRHSRLLITAALALCVLSLLIFGLFFRQQLTTLSAENAAAQSQISALEAGNLALQEQMDAMNNVLQQQVSDDALLLNGHVSAYLSEDMQTISISFYLIPKLFQENAQAYVTITNQENPSVSQTLKCSPMGQWYFCRAELPVINGYRYAFLLATDSGYQEQSLQTVGYFSYFQDLWNATRYYLDPSANVRRTWNVQDTTYTFSQPIASPLLDFASGYAGYEAIDVTLYHNGEAIYTESCRDAFQTLGGPYMRSEFPLLPDIRVTLPQLSIGDTLTLEISATHYNGQTLTNVLESLEVTE